VAEEEGESRLPAQQGETKKQTNKQTKTPPKTNQTKENKIEKGNLSHVVEQLRLS